jgi:hypothetical protein
MPKAERDREREREFRTHRVAFCLFPFLLLLLSHKAADAAASRHHAFSRATGRTPPLSARTALVALDFSLWLTFSKQKKANQKSQSAAQ